MMESPFKFPDSYTKDDRDIFFGRDLFFHKPGISMEDSIPPLQGLAVWLIRRWTAFNAGVFCAYSAKNNVEYSVKQEIAAITSYFHAYSAKSEILLCPERAAYYKAGQRPARSNCNSNQP